MNSPCIGLNPLKSDEKRAGNDYFFTKIAYILTTKPAIIRIGATVMRIGLYISDSSHTSGDGICPPVINIIPKKINPIPIRINL